MLFNYDINRGLQEKKDIASGVKITKLKEAENPIINAKKQQKNTFKLVSNSHLATLYLKSNSSKNI